MGKKSNKMFSLDNSIIAQLNKINNASKLANDLFIEYFNKKDVPVEESFEITDKMSVDEKMKVLKKKQKFEKTKKQNNKKISEIKLNTLIKQWFYNRIKNGQPKPQVLELVDFMKAREISLQGTDCVSILSQFEVMKQIVSKKKNNKTNSRSKIIQSK